MTPREMAEWVHDHGPGLLMVGFFAALFGVLAVLAVLIA